jgi:hypothetical protein
MNFSEVIYNSRVKVLHVGLQLYSYSHVSRIEIGYSPVM